MKALSVIIITLIGIVACQPNKSVKDPQKAREESLKRIEEMRPKILWATKQYDMGQIKEGEKREFDFKFKNVGKSPLQITNAQSSCGCTVADFPKAPIPPGGEGKIHVIYNSTGKPGIVNKSITITANTDPSIEVLYIVGQVIPKN
ncbi:MAG: DUF1573 domain-containing protein [Bacteroidia bacterium]|nr:DUF1573 domain-containing protein [Bacteroidia bacterium]MDW8301990.1 DUF1573 domain-containing protein [Bacteroidia bacterium]